MPDSKSRGFPIIGNDCYIGSGAKIIGGISIGESYRIGANCIVTESVPGHSVIVLKKPRVIKKENLSNQWIRFKDYEK